MSSDHSFHKDVLAKSISVRPSNIAMLDIHDQDLDLFYIYGLGVCSLLLDFKKAMITMFRFFSDYFGWFLDIS